MIQILGHAAMISAALACVVFVITFTRLSGGEWRRSPGGQVIMAFVAVAIVGIGLSVLRAVLDDIWNETWRHWSRALLYTALTLVVGRLTWLMVRAQRDGRDHAHDAH